VYLQSLKWLQYFNILFKTNKKFQHSFSDQLLWQLFHVYVSADTGCTGAEEINHVIIALFKIL